MSEKSFREMKEDIRSECNKRLNRCSTRMKKAIEGFLEPFTDLESVLDHGSSFHYFQAEYQCGEKQRELMELMDKYERDVNDCVQKIKILQEDLFYETAAGAIKEKKQAAANNPPINAVDIMTKENIVVKQEPLPLIPNSPPLRADELVNDISTTEVKQEQEPDILTNVKVVIQESNEVIEGTQPAGEKQRGPRLVSALSADGRSRQLVLVTPKEEQQEMQETVQPRENDSSVQGVSASALMGQSADTKEVRESRKRRSDRLAESLLPKQTPSRPKIPKKKEDLPKPKFFKGAYFWFLDENRARITEKVGPGLVAVAKAAGAEWQALADKSKYMKLAEEDQLRYKREMTAFAERKRKETAANKSKDRAQASKSEPSGAASNVLGSVPDQPISVKIEP